MLFLPQLKNNYNAHFFSMLDNFFNFFDIKTYTINNKIESEIKEILNSNENVEKELTIITIECIKEVFENLLPIIKPYSHYLYWKYEQYKLMSDVARIINAKAHYTFYGLYF